MINRMPEVFQTRGRSWQTSLLAPVGPSTIWDNPAGTPISSITDGTSNTIVVVAADQVAVNWTQPEDLAYPDPEAFARLYDSGFWALFADGSVRHLQPANPAVFHALFTRAGGEVIPSDLLEVSRPRLPYAQPPQPTPPPAGMGMMSGPGGMQAMMGAMSGAGMPGGATMRPSGMSGMMPMPGMMGGQAASKKKGVHVRDESLKKIRELRKSVAGTMKAAETDADAAKGGAMGMMPGMGRMTSMEGMMGGMPGMMPGAGSATSDQIAALKARVEQLRQENQTLRERLRQRSPEPSDAPQTETTPEVKEPE